MMWNLICRQLAAALSRSTYESWIEPARPVAWDGATLTIAVASDYARQYLTSRYSATINRMLVGLQPGDSRLMILVQPA